jgi:hypothetical protein
MRTADVPDVRGSAVGLHPQQFLEIDRLALGFELLRALFFVASINAFCEDGMPHLAMASTRPPPPLRTIGAG